MERMGVDYDVGRVLEGTLTRPVFDIKVVHRELEIIKNDLHCNTVRICCQDIDRLMQAAEDALKQGLEVWLSPELFEKSEQETFDYIVKAATAAEKLHRQARHDLPGYAVGTKRGVQGCCKLLCKKWGVEYG